MWVHILGLIDILIWVWRYSIGEFIEIIIIEINYLYNGVIEYSLSAV